MNCRHCGGPMLRTESGFVCEKWNCGRLVLAPKEEEKMVKIPLTPKKPASDSTPRRKKSAASDEPLVVPFTVLIDHRERAGGWTFQGLVGDSRQKNRPLVVPTREIHMVTADYTVEGHDVYVERKSQSDFLGSISGGHDNLEAEFERMKIIVDAGGHCCMIVESSLDKIVDELESPACMRRVTPAAVVGVVASWPMRFGVPIHFAGTRRLAEILAFRVLSKFVEKTNKELASVEQ